MANWNIKNVALRGVTGTVPNRPVRTADFPFFSQEDADTFDATVGIKNRYIAPDDICASDLCSDAAERLIAGLGWEKESIDVLLSRRSRATTRHRLLPPSCSTDSDCPTPLLCSMSPWDAADASTASQWLPI